MGLTLPLLANEPRAVVSAYADVNVFIQGKEDVLFLQESLALYEKASTAKVKWEKSEACLIGCWSQENTPDLPGNLGWRKSDIKVLGVHIGTEDLEMQNWEGVLEKVQARLSKWKWLLPQLSYRGRVLIVNNLVASSVWHKLMVLVPPPNLLERLQKLLVDFFWSGHHWVRALVLYIPVADGGQDLINIISKTVAFRLQALQRLLYGSSLWTATVRLLLMKAGGHGFDRQLFLQRLQSVTCLV